MTCRNEALAKPAEIVTNSRGLERLGEIICSRSQVAYAVRVANERLSEQLRFADLWECAAGRSGLKSPSHVEESAKIIMRN